MGTWAHCCVSNLPDSTEPVRDLDRIVRRAKDELDLLSAGELDGISSNDMV